MKIRVFHSYYGCETGCCGHAVKVEGDDRRHFEFMHPSSEDLQDPKAWAREFATKVLTRTNPSCLPTIDWDSLELVEEGWEECSAPRDGETC